MIIKHTDGGGCLKSKTRVNSGQSIENSTTHPHLKSRVCFPEQSLELKQELVADQ